jgi:hypothetical protein
MSAALDFIPMLRFFILASNKHQKAANASGSGGSSVGGAGGLVAQHAQHAIDFISSSAFVDLKLAAKTVLELLLDHKKLLLRRKYICMFRQGAFPYLLTPAAGETRAANSVSRGRRNTSDGRPELFEATTSAGSKFLPFSSMHNLLRPQTESLPTLEPGVVAVSEHVVARPRDSDANEGDDDIDDAASVNASTHDDSPPGRAGADEIADHAKSALLFDPFADGDPFAPPSREEISAAKNKSTSSQPSATVRGSSGDFAPSLGAGKAAGKAAAAAAPLVALPPPPGGASAATAPKKPARSAARGGGASSDLLDFDVTDSTAGASKTSSADLLNVLSDPRTASSSVFDNMSSQFDPFQVSAPPAPLDPDTKYRVVNKDTGEAMDIRMLVDTGAASHGIGASNPFFHPQGQAQAQAQAQAGGIGQLRPPPQVQAARQTSSKQVPQGTGNVATTDPFSASTTSMSWATWGETTPNPNAGNSDPFAFDIFGFGSPKSGPTSQNFAPSQAFAPTTTSCMRQQPAQQPVFISTNPARAAQQQQQQQARDPFADLLNPLSKK